MPSSQLKRAERAIGELQDGAELPAAVTEVFKELVDVIRAMEARLSLLENDRLTP